MARARRRAVLAAVPPSTPTLTPPSTSTPLATVADVAKFLSVSEHWVHRQVEHDRIPFFKVGRYLRFDLDALARWLPDARRRRS